MFEKIYVRKWTRRDWVLLSIVPNEKSLVGVALVLGGLKSKSPDAMSGP